MSNYGVLSTYGVRSRYGVLDDEGVRPNYGIGSGDSWSPANLFGPSDVGLWYDYSDTASLRQDSAGTTAVTTLGQPVGLVLDKSRGLVSAAGPSITNPTFIGTTGWTGQSGATISAANNQMTLISPAGDSYTAFSQGISVTAGTYYQFGVTIVSVSANAYATINVTSTAGGGTVFSSAAGNAGDTITVRYFATSTTTVFLLFSSGSNNASNGTAVFSNVTSSSVPGNHAIQSTPTARPVWDARKNLLTYSEELDNAAWNKGNTTITTNQTASPDGTTTADLLASSTASAVHFINRAASVSIVAGTTYTYSVYLKKGTGATAPDIVQMSFAGNEFGSVQYANFNITAGTVGTTAGGIVASVNSVGNGWMRCRITATATMSAASSVMAAVNFTNNNDGLGRAPSYVDATTSNVFIWGAQLEYGSTATSYQRVTTATDYADVGFSRGALFDGSDDFLVTAANLVMSSTNKVTVIAGVFSRVGGTYGPVVELTVNADQSNGTFLMSGNGNLSTYRVVFLSRGTSSGAAQTNSTAYNPPITLVQTGQGDISNDVSILRLNGIQVGLSTNDQGSGNYSSALLYLGSRGGTNAPLNGRITQLIIIGRLLSDAELAQVERYVATQSGVLIP